MPTTNMAEATSSVQPSFSSFSDMQAIRENIKMLSQMADKLLVDIDGATTRRQARKEAGGGGSGTSGTAGRSRPCDPKRKLVESEAKRKRDGRSASPMAQVIAGTQVTDMRGMAIVPGSKAVTVIRTQMKEVKSVRSIRSVQSMISQKPYNDGDNDSDDDSDDDDDEYDRISGGSTYTQMSEKPSIQQMGILKEKIVQDTGMPIGASPQIRKAIEAPPQIKKPRGAPPQITRAIEAPPQITKAKEAPPQIKKPRRAPPQIRRAIEAPPQITELEGEPLHSTRATEAPPQIKKPRGAPPQITRAIEAPPQITKAKEAPPQIKKPRGEPPQIRRAIEAPPQITELKGEPQQRTKPKRASPQITRAIEAPPQITELKGEPLQRTNPKGASPQITRAIEAPPQITELKGEPLQRTKPKGASPQVTKPKAAPLQITKPIEALSRDCSPHPCECGVALIAECGKPYEHIHECRCRVQMIEYKQTPTFKSAERSRIDNYQCTGSPSPRTETGYDSDDCSVTTSAYGVCESMGDTCSCSSRSYSRASTDTSCHCCACLLKAQRSQTSTSICSQNRGRRRQRPDCRYATESQILKTVSPDVYCSDRQGRVCQPKQQVPCAPCYQPAPQSQCCICPICGSKHIPEKPIGDLNEVDSCVCSMCRSSMLSCYPPERRCDDPKKLKMPCREPSPNRCNYGRNPSPVRSDKCNCSECTHASPARSQQCICAECSQSPEPSTTCICEACGDTPNQLKQSRRPPPEKRCEDPKRSKMPCRTPSSNRCNYSQSPSPVRSDNCNCSECKGGSPDPSQQCIYVECGQSPQTSTTCCCEECGGTGSQTKRPASKPSSQSRKPPSEKQCEDPKRPKIPCRSTSWNRCNCCRSPSPVWSDKCNCSECKRASSDLRQHCICVECNQSPQTSMTCSCEECGGTRSQLKRPAPKHSSSYSSICIGASPKKRQKCSPCICCKCKSEPAMAHRPDGYESDEISVLCRYATPSISTKSSCQSTKRSVVLDCSCSFCAAQSPKEGCVCEIALKASSCLCVNCKCGKRLLKQLPANICDLCKCEFKEKASDVKKLEKHPAECLCCDCLCPEEPTCYDRIYTVEGDLQRPPTCSSIQSQPTHKCPCPDCPKYLAGEGPIKHHVVKPGTKPSTKPSTESTTKPAVKPVRPKEDKKKMADCCTCCICTCESELSDDEAPDEKAEVEKQESAETSCEESDATSKAEDQVSVNEAKKEEDKKSDSSKAKVEEDDKISTIPPCVCEKISVKDGKLECECESCSRIDITDSKVTGAASAATKDVEKDVTKESGKEETKKPGKESVDEGSEDCADICEGTTPSGNLRTCECTSVEAPIHVDRKESKTSVVGSKCSCAGICKCSTKSALAEEITGRKSDICKEGESLCSCADVCKCSTKSTLTEGITSKKSDSCKEGESLCSCASICKCSSKSAIAVKSTSGKSDTSKQGGDTSFATCEFGICPNNCGCADCPFLSKLDCKRPIIGAGTTKPPVLPATYDQAEGGPDLSCTEALDQIRNILFRGKPYQPYSPPTRMLRCICPQANAGRSRMESFYPQRCECGPQNNQGRFGNIPQDRSRKNSRNGAKLIRSPEYLSKVSNFQSTSNELMGVDAGVNSMFNIVFSELKNIKDMLNCGLQKMGGDNLRAIECSPAELVPSPRCGPPFVGMPPIPRAMGCLPPTPPLCCSAPILRITSVTTVGCRSLLISWRANPCVGIIGYEVYVDGCLKSRSFSPARDSAVAYGVDLRVKHCITVIAIVDQCCPPTCFPPVEGTFCYKPPNSSESSQSPPPSSGGGLCPMLGF